MIGLAADGLMMNCGFAVWNIQQHDESHLDPVLGPCVQNKHDIDELCPK